MATLANKFAAALATCTAAERHHNACERRYLDDGPMPPAALTRAGPLGKGLHAWEWWSVDELTRLLTDPSRRKHRPLARKLLLIARAATGFTRHAAVGGACVALLAGTMGLAEADQQFNSSNPRDYDFRGALQEIRSGARPGDVAVYVPAYLGSVVDYYGGGLRTEPLGARPPRLRRGHRVFLLASFQDKAPFRKAAVHAVLRLRRTDRQVDSFTRPQIRVWEFSR